MGRPGFACALLVALLLPLRLGADAPRPTIVVSPRGPVRTLAAAIAKARPGTRIVVEAGVYREPMIVVDRPVEIVGVPGAILDGESRRQIMAISGSDVTVRGLTFRNVGMSFTEDMAAVRIVKAARCRIEDNRIENGFFGIYLAAVDDCTVAGNVLLATRIGESTSGNGIHLWQSTDVRIMDNVIRGHRDGIYFEFVQGADVARNRSEENQRYGLHFMYSHSCRYRDNVFRRNGAGVAVMYTRNVEMTGNRFEDNWGSAAYGLLLKEIADPVLRRNRFTRNTVGLLSDGSTNIIAEANTFDGNGWAAKLMANTTGGRFAGNDFVRNTFDVGTNGNTGDTQFTGNYFDGYRGYDLDRDGVGDVPHRPVTLFSVLVERNPPAMILLRSAFAGLLEAAERVVPSLTPDALADVAPAMRPAATHPTLRTTGR